MQLPFYTLLALATATSLVSADYFANFFTDEHCTQDGSIGFDMTNPGCFAWRGAHSVYIPKTSFPNEQFCLVMTHDDDHCSYSSLALADPTPAESRRIISTKQASAEIQFHPLVAILPDDRYVMICNVDEPP
uniref:Uncharacterized protein n=1 Tax=Kwoniella bestiolae CBS 10118 TaxID=1296100 RepID=A0A1B9GFQ3_9TREE|nr:hypothetical protein I302_01395 [Kwoniella bestiolae CBS 10118]OCF29882.1 hypothetical protein I302_01395 [Kwoniella bestiolae CBS 10118]